MALIQSTRNSLSELFSGIGDSQFCARCLLGASSKGILQGEDTAGHKTFWTNFTQDVDFWREQMQFLFAVRTEDETRQLLARLNRCSCQLSDPRIMAYHQEGRKMESSLLVRTRVDRQTSSVAFINSLLVVVSTALGFAHRKAVAKRTAKRWPTCPEDLLPFGPENLVQSFIIWSHFIPDNLIFLVATQCIDLCGSLLIPSVVNSGLTLRVIEVGRRLFDRTWETIRLRAEGTRRAFGKTFVTQTGPILQYFIDFYDPLPLRQQATVLDGCEMKAVQLFSLLAYVANDPFLCLQSSKVYRVRFARRGLAFYRRMRLYIDPLPPILLHPEICELYVEESSDESSEDEDENEDEDDDGANFEVIDGPVSHPEQPLEVSQSDEHVRTAVPKEDPIYDGLARTDIDHIRNARFDLNCSARDCPNSIQTTGREFQRCSGCNIALYCTKKCQSDAWNSDQYPHKIICKTLQKLVALCGSEVIFRFPDKTYYPEDLATLIIEKWKQGDVTLSDLFQIEGWASYRNYPESLPMRECKNPGFEDYDDQVRQLSEKNPALKAQYLILKKLSFGVEYDMMRKMFGSTRMDD
ncbi:hypothetical protein BDN70DRAFT_931524 [Pholiota conissans]|uniref:MYND-type domain-containing protein n=1 Tax=Pholiota conissans TaxID=109636 RepID=A0A9P5Z5R0_9AGAR|nr:hypothetical protein BDN70DRAFT_931524 [Pholiota conissans]